MQTYSGDGGSHVRETVYIEKKVDSFTKNQILKDYKEDLKEKIYNLKYLSSAIRKQQEDGEWDCYSKESYNKTLEDVLELLK